MAHSQIELTPRAAFADLPITAPGSGVVVQERDELGIASVLARRGQHEALTKRVRERFGIELSPGPRRSAAGGCAFIATGPGAWIVTVERASNGCVTSLTDALGDLAAISDQSDGQAVLRVSGPKAREALCKIVPIDLHPRIFRSGAVAATVAAHVGATLWRLDDDPSGHAVFEIAVFRSLAESFWRALSESAAEFGVRMNGRG
ncbi:sarcosine oxidase subunit gamma [Peristeroidobacter soli]|jgi:sarcosine oxidase subunit gamma|uniref:sarcosine oxidase subunit gamma n=1 Tax=Peristeroidobacter soli TaxID=2497877 RepID=UPI00101B942F|nr:sarcosine oxidase subunit gamma family protein [Peristeroidobacter soli]